MAGDQAACLCHCVSSQRAHGNITKTTAVQRRSSQSPMRADQQHHPDLSASKVCLALDKHQLPTHHLPPFPRVSSQI